jgi:hypothetical protein
MKEKDFIDKKVTFEDELVEVIRPPKRRALANEQSDQFFFEIKGRTALSVWVIRINQKRPVSPRWIVWERELHQITH